MTLSNPVRPQSVQTVSQPDDRPDPQAYEWSTGSAGRMDAVKAGPGSVGSEFTFASVGTPLRVFPIHNRERFDELAERWTAETAMLSSVQKIVLNSAYQHIIGMGERAVPLILERLRDHGGLWFWALAAITNEDPADGLAAYDDARQAWLDWGVAAGYLP